MRVALVHDWLTGMRGGEKVLAELCALFPEAPVYTLVHREGAAPEIERGRRVVTSMLQRLPFGRTHHRYYLPLFPAAARSLRLEGPLDLVISSSHAAAKAVRVPAGARHVCYCHSPMRYVWDDHGDYFSFGRSRYARRAALAPWRSALRRWDRAAADGVDLFVANSEYVRGRVRALYGRDAVVVYPPVDTEFFTPSDAARDDAALAVSALVPYKRVDLAVRAFSRSGRRLLVAGSGTERRALERVAGPSVEFLGAVSDERLRDLYRTSRLLVFPGREDFGLVPVEAQACGLAVVAFGEGGALETVVDGRTGVLFGEQTVDALDGGLARAEATTFDPAALRANALRFSRERFRREILAVLERALRARNRER
jgi:glycosyltransferase involved in cell wall biosynthesis